MILSGGRAGERAGTASGKHPSALSRTIQRARPLLGTLVAIRATAADEVLAHAAIDRAFAVVAHCHARMSARSPDSDLAAIARARAGEAVPLDAETRACLAAALALADETGGAFDPVLPGDGATWRDLAVAEGCGMPSRPLAVDLSGIAKGHAVDRACEALRAAGASAGVVNAGGDIRVFGDLLETIALTPVHAAQPAAIRLRDGALASSDVAGSLAEYGQPRHRDGRDGRPVAPGFVAVTAPDCRTADALTKVVLALGDGAAPLLSRHDATAHLHRLGGAWRRVGATP